ncbi:MAG: hypothetical protein DCC71_22645 [Proteobacteria bacterium]|nr:MAG: hypothetical protein DCC71_22645 [Pseudomonadota bacterium]
MRGLVRAVFGMGLAALVIGSGCGEQLVGPVTPGDGAVVNTFSFPISVKLTANADPNTLSVELNGDDITSQLTGGPLLFTGTIDPGAPLLDDNTLVVRVARSGQAPGGPTQVGVVKTIEFQYLPPKARASVVANQSECPTGPLAHCRPGDVLVANTDARFVIQGDLARNLHFTGTFGGNIIDAETVVGGVPQGNDNFFEIQPMLNIEQVIHATSVEIVNDGQDGTSAIVRSCGPDDLLDDINPSSQVASLGGLFPAGVDDVDYDAVGCTEYRLNPQTRTMEVVTTIENLSPDPITLFVGDFLNGGGELEQYTPIATQAPATILRRAGVGEMLANFGIRALSLYGYGQAEGVDYALIAPAVPEVPVPSSSFTTSGVSFVMHGATIPQALLGGSPNFEVPANDSNSFRRWFEVGDGSGGNAVDSMVDVLAMANGTLTGCVREAVTNAPIPGARVVARDIVTSPPAAVRDVVRSHWVTDANGCYEGRVPTGSYQVAAGKRGYPYEGGGSTPLLHPVTVTAGGTVVQDVVLPQTGRLRVEAVDHASDPVPARVGVVGFDPSPEIVLTGTVISANDTRTQVFYDQTADPIPTGLSRTEYTDANGVVEIDLEPGTYQIAVSRGSEWSLYTQQVAITAATTTTVNAQLAHVVDSTGTISADYHVHMIDSPDSRVSRKDRIEAFAGEGVDNIIATDHAYVTDLDAEIAALGFTSFVNSTPGEEVTTFDYGHFNAYPQGQDTSRIQTMGSTDHGGAAPPGQDFPSSGYYNLSPAQIEAAVLAKPQNAGKETVVHVNHIDSHFSPLRIDTSLTPPQSVLDPNAVDGDGFPLPANPLFFRLDPSIPNFYHHFAGLELWNGYTIGQQGEFLDDRIGIWMNLLNQGLLTTAISDTDTHELHNLRSGGARSWTPSSTDAPSGVVDVEIARAVRAGKMVGGQGIYVQTRLLATDGSGGTASLVGTVPAGAQPGTAQAGTLVTVTNAEVELEITVQAPTWAPYDEIEIYRNASTQVAGSNGGTPTLFTALPTATLAAGPDFTVATVPVNGSQRLETTKTVLLSGLTQDEWIVVVVKGNAGTSPPMFPVMADGVSLAQNPDLASLSTVTAAENGIRALGVTNALYVDVDQNGVFDAPGVSVVP